MSGPPSPFIEKLQNILNDPKNSEIIQFDQETGRLEIVNKKEMERILPTYFRHGRFQSFVRQLNWYGFYKTNNKLSHSYSHPDLEKGIEQNNNYSDYPPSSLGENTLNPNRINRKF